MGFKEDLLAKKSQLIEEKAKRFEQVRKPATEGLFNEIKQLLMENLIKNPNIDQVSITLSEHDQKFYRLLTAFNNFDVNYLRELCEAENILLDVSYDYGYQLTFIINLNKTKERN